MNTLTIAAPARVAVPRGALFVGWLADAVQAVRLRQQEDTALRNAERRVRDAAAVRGWAMQLQDAQPHLAADLRAAADRHGDGL